MNRKRDSNRRLLSRSPSIARQVGRQQVKKTIVVVCEGTKTEPQYIDALAAEPDVRDVAAVHIRQEGADEGAVPLTLVKRAIQIQVRAEKESGEVDEVWCIFDVEWPTNHPHLREAVSLANEHGIHLAISNPCFELWLILHFEQCGRFLDNDEARHRRKALDSKPNKRIDPKVYMENRALATERAAWLDQKHERDRTDFPDNNPSSGMHKLIKSVSPP